MEHLYVAASVKVNLAYTFCFGFMVNVYNMRILFFFYSSSLHFINYCIMTQTVSMTIVEMKLRLTILQYQTSMYPLFLIHFLLKQIIEKRIEKLTISLHFLTHFNFYWSFVVITFYSIASWYFMFIFTYTPRDNICIWSLWLLWSCNETGVCQAVQDGKYAITSNAWQSNISEIAYHVGEHQLFFVQIYIYCTVKSKFLKISSV